MEGDLTAGAMQLVGSGVGGREFIAGGDSVDAAAEGIVEGSGGILSDGEKGGGCQGEKVGSVAGEGCGRLVERVCEARYGVVVSGGCPGIGCERRV